MAKGDHDEELVRRLAELLDEKGLTEIAYTSGRTSIRVSRQAAAAAPPPAAAPAPPTSAAQAATPSEEAPAPTPDANHPGAVTSPMVGTAYLQPEPGAPPYVNPGDPVQQGQTLLLIEAMKTFNEIRATHAGTVKRILIDTGAPVEFGDVLMIIE